MRKRDWTNPSESRLAQTKRLFNVAAIIAARRSNRISVHTLNEKLREKTGGTWCNRTIRRDLKALIELGLVRSVPAADRYRAVQMEYEWIGDPDLARLAITAAPIAKLPVTPSLALKAFLRWLPEPWELDSERIVLATSAARLTALLDSGDPAYLKGELVFHSGEGWDLVPAGEPTDFDRAKSLPAIATEYVDAVAASQSQESVSDQVACLA